MEGDYQGALVKLRKAALAGSKQAEELIPMVEEEMKPHAAGGVEIF